jgi:methyl-accepting chemotaxis protein
MGLTVFMRRFSIRFRMIGAIAIVLLLLAAVGASGWWGMHRSAALGEQFVTGAFEQRASLSRLQMALADTSRFEKDMVIQYESPEQMSLASTRWEKAHARALEQIGQLVSASSGEERELLQTMQQDLAAYTAAVLPVVIQIQGGAYDSATVANRMLSRAHEQYEALGKKLAQTDLLIGAQAELSQAESRSVNQQTLIWFVLAVALAALVVVPTTLANMQSICAPLDEARQLAQAIAAGDLSQPVSTQGHDEITALLRGLGTMQHSLSGIVTQVRSATDSINTASAEIASGNQDLSARTEQAASNLEETAASMEQLTSTVRQSADAACQANQLAASASEIAVRGGSVVGQVVTTMDEINASSKKISDIIGVIDAIAFQTNILALNAAVEAARAGEQGRGFAVVASEVRSLAQRSAEAAKEIKGLIGRSVDRVEAGSRLVAQAGQTMSEIVGSVQRVSDIIGEITAAAGEQSDGIGQVNVAVNQLDQMTQQNAALVEESAAAAESLKDQAARLAQVVQVFRIDAGQVRATDATPPPAHGHRLAAVSKVKFASPRPLPSAFKPVARNAPQRPSVASTVPKTGPTPASKPARQPEAAGSESEWESF